MVSARQAGKFSDWSSCDPLQVQLPALPCSASPPPSDSRRCSMVNRHWRISLTTQLTADFIAQSAAVFRSPRLQENLPLRAEQGRCCPAWAAENGPDPQFRRVVLRHREAQQGEYRFSGERSEPKPIGPLTGRLEIGTQAEWAVKKRREIGTQAEWAINNRQEVGTQADRAVNRQTRDRNSSQLGSSRLAQLKLPSSPLNEERHQSQCGQRNNHFQ